MQLNTTTIQFPEIKLQTRDAHKLRGYFGNLFKDHSPLLHNHYDDGTFRYKYPLVQYKIIDNIPTLVGIADGAELLFQLFLKVKNLNINDKEYPVYSKNINNQSYDIDDKQQLFQYKFKTLWMGINQENYKKYIQLNDIQKQNELLDKQLQNNILSFYKGIGFYTKQQIMATATLTQKQTNFKDQVMMAFDGAFVANAFLPDYIGIGKAVSRGFGTVKIIR